MPIVCGAVMAALCACGDKEETTQAPAAQPKAKEATTAEVKPEEQAPESTAEETDAAQELHDQIYDLMVYGIAPQLASPNSPLAPQIKEVLRMLNEQYELEKAELAGTTELARLAILAADMRRTFGAWDSAIKDYERALGDYNAMSDEDKADDTHRRWLSNIYYGMAFSYMQKNNAAKALEYYEMRLANDEKRAETLPEFKPGAQVSMQVVPIVHDLISSLRTKAECRAMTDPEEARTDYRTAIERAEQLLGLPDFSVHRQYMLLLSSAANHESRCNDNKKAMEYCMKVMKHCEKLHNGTNDARVRQFMIAQIKQCQEMYKQLEAGIAPAADTTPQEITTEPLNADLPPLPNDTAAPAAAPAEAPAAAEETTTVSETPAVTAEPQPAPAPAKSNKKNKRKRRR
ncbi:MAG: hypothetical protein IJA81_10995 [Akkermansia sp.]|nr:hypothetical protein [Akkermansia sp.]